MSYKNSSIYVQRQINRLLRMQKAFARVYIDDIVIFSYIKKKHEIYLREVFVVLTNNNIFIKSTKIYLKYSNVALFDQKINSLKFVIFEKKLKTIAKLHFSRIFRQLKTYLSLTNWLRDYISHYVDVFKSFQNRKIEFFRNEFVVENVRRIYFNKNWRRLTFCKTFWQNLFIWFTRIQKNNCFSISTSTRNSISTSYCIIWKNSFTKTTTNIFLDTSLNQYFFWVDLL